MTEIITTTNRWSLETEQLFQDFDNAVMTGFEAYIKKASIMLELAERDDVKAEATAWAKTNGGSPARFLTHEIHTRWKGKLSEAGISQIWTVAQCLLAHTEPQFMLSVGISDTDVLYQAALYAKSEHRNPHNQLPPASVVANALEKFSVLNRDEARAMRDPSSTARLATKPETTTATGEGLFSTEAVRRHHEADTNAREILNARLEREGETPLTPNLSLEMWAAFKAGANDMTLSAVRRLVDSGASGEQGAALLAMYLLAECGCDPVVLRELTAFMNLEYTKRTANKLLNQLIDADVTAHIPPQTKIIRQNGVTDDEIKTFLNAGWNQDRIKVHCGVGYSRIKRIRDALANEAVNV